VPGAASPGIATHHQITLQADGPLPQPRTKAEAVDFVVTQAIGLQIETATSDYIQRYDGKAETLTASLNRIQHAAAGIIAALECPFEAAPTV